jgi:hypothetical protein
VIFQFFLFYNSVWIRILKRNFFSDSDPAQIFGFFRIRIHNTAKHFIHTLTSLVCHDSLPFDILYHYGLYVQLNIQNKHRRQLRTINRKKHYAFYSEFTAQLHLKHSIPYEHAPASLHNIFTQNIDRHLAFTLRNK